jgi:hypothetical protein
MRTWFKNVLIAAAVFVLCWGGALWYWRRSNTMPGSADVVLYLLLLPLVVLFLLWFAKRLVLLASAAPLASSAPAAAAPAPAPARATPVLHLVAGALRLPHGQSAQELRDAIGANEARPALDAELMDDYGFPVMSARVDGLDTEAVKESMAAWLATQGLPDPGFKEEQWRALALGADVAVELGQAASVHAHLGAEGAAGTVPILPMLQLLPLLPTGWDLGQRLAAGRWLQHLVQQQGWPAERLALSAAAERGSAEPLALLTQLSQQGEHDAQPFAAIVLACASHLGEDTIDAWTSQGLLFTARNQRGQIPGEGAAGLLVADGSQARLFEAPDAPQLHATLQGAHAASTDGPGQLDAGLLSSLGKDALRCAASQAGDVHLVVGDADHRGSRVGELMAAAAAAAPQLDTATQVIGVAGCCGRAGAVGAVAALVLARQESDDNASHVLYLSNQDAFQRSAAVVRPAPAAATTMATSVAPPASIKQPSAAVAA